MERVHAGAETMMRQLGLSDNRTSRIGRTNSLKRPGGGWHRSQFGFGTTAKRLEKLRPGSRRFLTTQHVFGASGFGEGRL